MFGQSPDDKVPSPELLADILGGMDIYLLDQVMKGRFRPGMRILDAGCGGGRNSLYFIRAGLDVCGVDREEASLVPLRQMTGKPENFRAESIEHLSFDDRDFEVVICSAVLHFCDSESQFMAMMREMWRVLVPGGFFFARLMSTIGIESRVQHIEDRLFRLPSGQVRFLVDEDYLLACGRELDGILEEPIKTTNVQNQRCMTTWCTRKAGSGC